MGRARTATASRRCAPAQVTLLVGELKELKEKLAQERNLRAAAEGEVENLTSELESVRSQVGTPRSGGSSEAAGSGTGICTMQCSQQGGSSVSGSGRGSPSLLPSPAQSGKSGRSGRSVNTTSTRRDLLDAREPVSPGLSSSSSLPPRLMPPPKDSSNAPSSSKVLPLSRAKINPSKEPTMPMLTHAGHAPPGLQPSSPGQAVMNALLWDTAVHTRAKAVPLPAAGMEVVRRLVARVQQLKAAARGAAAR